MVSNDGRADPASGSPETAADCQRVRRALDEVDAGCTSGPAVAALVSHLAPVVYSTVFRTLRRELRSIDVGDLTETVTEFTQHVFEKLWDRSVRALRVWNPERGRSLRNWVSLLTRRRVLDLLRSPRTAPWLYESVPPEFFDTYSSGPTPEQSASAQEAWRMLCEHVEETWTEDAQRMFHLFYVQRRSVAQIMEETGRSRNAVDQWARRIREAMRKYLNGQGLIEGVTR